MTCRFLDMNNMLGSKTLPRSLSFIWLLPPRGLQLPGIGRYARLDEPRSLSSQGLFRKSWTTCSKARCVVCSPGSAASPPPCQPQAVAPTSPHISSQALPEFKKMHIFKYGLSSWIKRGKITCNTSCFFKFSTSLEVVAQTPSLEFKVSSRAWA